MLSPFEYDCAIINAPRNFDAPLWIREGSVFYGIRHQFMKHQSQVSYRVSGHHARGFRARKESRRDVWSSAGGARTRLSQTLARSGYPTR